MRARSAYPRGLCPRAPRIPLAAPDGGPTCSPVTHPFGHRLPGSLPQRIAEVCLLPTRIVLSQLMLQARIQDHKSKVFAGASATVPVLAEPTGAQREAFDLIGAPIPLTLK